MSEELRKTEYHILAADIGGTNSRFAHFRANNAGELELISHIWLKTAAAMSFADLLQNLRNSDFPFDPRQADIVGIAIAGPITKGFRVNPPLIPWEVDIIDAKLDYGFRRATLINDFVAQAFSCISPIGKSAETILTGISEPRSTIAVIGAGTGLGKADIVLHESFKNEFHDSDAMSAVLANLPVFLIRDQNSGLWGTVMKAAKELASDLS